MGGAEGMDRATFKKVSEIFNAFVYEPSPAPAPAPVQAQLQASALGPPSSSAPASSPAPPLVFQAVEAPSQLAPVPSFRHPKLGTLDEDQPQVAAVDLVATTREGMQKEVLAAVNRRESILLIQRAGFGKTHMTLKLLGNGNFVLFLVPLLPLVEQSLADIRKLGYPCADWKDVANDDAASIVGRVCGVVATFDDFSDPAVAELLVSAHDSGQQCYTIVDEAHQILKDKFRFKFNRAYELSSRLRERNVKVTWLLLSATLRQSDEHPLAAALHVDIDVVVRGAAKPDNINMVLIETGCLGEAIQRVKGLQPEIIYVKTYSEARRVAEAIPAAAVWASRLTPAEKHAAVQHLERGGILVATYGFGVGLNLKVRSKFPSKICAFGIPWSAESAVQAAGRMREGGVFWIIEWELGTQAKSPIRGLQELATILLVEDPEAVFQLFEVDTPPAARPQPLPVPKYSDIRKNALLAKAFTASVSWCAICCGPHASSTCSKVRGVCFTCGSTGHPAKTCQSSRLSQVPPHFHRVFMYCLLDTLVSAEHRVRRVLLEMQASAVRRGRC